MWSSRAVMAKPLLLITLLLYLRHGAGTGGINMTCSDYRVATAKAAVGEWPKVNGLPEVYADAAGVTFGLTKDCGIIIDNQIKAGTMSLVFNATVNSTPTEGGYIIRADVGEYQGEGQFGVILWQVAPIERPFNKVSLVWDRGGYLMYSILGGPIQDAGIEPSQYCVLGAQGAPTSMVAHVERNSIFTVTVHMAGGQAVTRRWDLTDRTKGDPPTHLGIESNHAMTKVVFTHFEVSNWGTTTGAPPVSKTEVCFDKLKKQLMKYYIMLGVGLAVVLLHFAMAYHHVKGNFLHNNTPSWPSMVSTVVSGLDFCGEVGQVVYLSIVSDIAKSGQTHDAHKLHAYYVTSLVVMVLGLIYSVVLIGYVMLLSGRYMDRPLLNKYRAFFCIQAIVALTNLELVPYFPWDYRHFNDDRRDSKSTSVRDLEGYPTSRLLRLAALPIFFVDLPMMVLQCLTQNVDSLNFTQSVLILIQALSAVDMLCRFIVRVYVTSEERADRRDSTDTGSSTTGSRCSPFEIPPLGGHDRSDPPGLAPPLSSGSDSKDEENGQRAPQTVHVEMRYNPLTLKGLRKYGSANL